MGFDVQDEAMLKLDIHKNIPELLLDNTDRNRTSPFAFTGNKFEFRAVGSSANPAMPMTVLNTIVADSLNEFKKRVDELIDNGEKKEIAILQIIQKYIVESKKILFEGDGYSDDWEKEAAARGLENVKVTPLALDAMISRKSKELFERHQIFSDNELEARYEYCLKVIQENTNRIPAPWERWPDLHPSPGYQIPKYFDQKYSRPERFRLRGI